MGARHGMYIALPGTLGRSASVEQTMAKLLGAVLVAAFAMTACSGGDSATVGSTQQSSMSTSTPDQLCATALPAGHLNAASTTVGEVHATVVGPGSRPGSDAFVGSPDSAAAAWCWTGTPGDYVLYAAGPDGESVRIEGLAGETFTSTPAPGPAPIP